jgi:phosphomethylpyrimidine synthase
MNWSSKVDEFKQREHGLEKRDLTQLVTERMPVERR